LQGTGSFARSYGMNDRETRWKAVEGAYRDHADDVYRVAFAILRDPDAAVDVTHDTFARAFDRWHESTSTTWALPWVSVDFGAIRGLRQGRADVRSTLADRVD